MCAEWLISASPSPSPLYAGGSSQLANVVTGVVVLLCVGLFSAILYYVPMASLAAVINASVLNLINVSEPVP